MTNHNQREIKFRAWDTNDKSWRLPTDPDNDTIDAYEYLISLDGKLQDYKGKDCVLMQFTGLLDKNGVEIYSGDLVEASDELGGWSNPFEVVWHEDGWFIKHKTEETPIRRLYETPIIEVIGNIYENPELLKEKH